MKTVLLALTITSLLARPALAHCVNGDSGCVEPLTLAQARAASQHAFETYYLDVSAETDWSCVVGGQGATCTRWVRISGDLSSLECESSKTCYYDPEWGSQVCDVSVSCFVSSDEAAPGA